MDILNNLKINYENMKKSANDTSSQSTADNDKNVEENEEILNLKEDIQIQQKDLELVMMRKKNIHLVVDLVQNWVGKSITQLHTQMEVGNMPKNPKLSEQFKLIHALVTPQLKEIISQNEKRQQHDLENGIQKPDRAYNVVEDEFNNNTQDLINDVGTEEFISKNIRVRPTSGTTAVERDEKSEAVGNRTASNLLDMGQSMMDEEEKFYRNALMELDEQRERIKAERRTYENERIRMEEKLKLKQSKNK